MVVKLKEEIGDPVAFPEPAGPVEGEGEGTVPGAHQEACPSGGPAGAGHMPNHGPAVALALKGRLHGQILDLEHARRLLGHHAHGAKSAVVQRQQRSAVQIAVDHVLLFVSQQQEGEKVPLARLDSANIHAYASLSLIRVEEHISSGLSSPGCRNLSKRVRMCRIYFKNLRFLICYV